MMAISVSPDRDLRRTTPPAALITLTSATSRIFVATVAPSSAETFGLSAERQFKREVPRNERVLLAAETGGVKDGKRDPRDQGRGGDRDEPRRNDVCADSPTHCAEIAARADSQHRAGNHVCRADGKADESGALDNACSHQLRGEAGCRFELEDAPAQRPNNSPSARVCSEADRRGGQDHNPKWYLELRQVPRGDQREGDCGHRLLRVVGTVGIGEEGRSGDLQAAE